MFSMRRSSLMQYSAAILIGSAVIIAAWPSLVRNLFATSPYEAHGYCFLWEPGLVWLHVLSDFSIGASYVAISFTLATLVHRARRDIPFHWVFIAFGVFIIACGSTHFFEIWTLWVPTYWLSGSVKLLTAIASVATAVVLPPLVPKTLNLVGAARLSNQRKQQLEQANVELQRLYEQSAELSRLRTQFFANVSHELRTPLALILGPAEKLLASEGLSAAQRRDLDVVARNARILLDHVNDLLDVSKLDAAKMELAYAEVDLAALVRRVAGLFDSLAPDRAIDFVVDTPEALPAQVDAAKIERVCLNLLSNAFKFTPPGGQLRCQLRADEDAAILTVDDSGPGVSPEMRGAIFEPFRQADAGATRRFGGTGLGLSIVKGFVELHRGTVTVEDAPGGGARFVVRLPLAAPVGIENRETPRDAADDHPLTPRITPAAQTTPNLDATVNGDQGALVLVVEDNPDMNRFVVDTLAGEHRIVRAFNGVEGLRLARERRPDLIVSDIMMPEMSGEQLVQEVRRDRAITATPIILLTARADEESPARLLREGAQDFVTKPFSPDELRARVDNLVMMKRARDVLQQQLNSQSQDLVVLAAEASAGIRVRDEFLSVAAHELRTPITALVGYTQILQRRAERDETMAEKDRRAIRTIAEQSDRLRHLVQNLLDLSRLEGGGFAIAREAVDLRALLRGLVAGLGGKAARHAIAFTGLDEPLVVEGDAARLEQAFTNLLDNAVKYSPLGGPVVVELGREDSEAQVTITDRGIGIPDDARERIFQRFYRADNIDTENIVGFGVGLYLVSEIVRQHGGTVAVDSAEGQGSTFTIRLPLQ